MDCQYTRNIENDKPGNSSFHHMAKQNDGNVCKLLILIEITVNL